MAWPVMKRPSFWKFQKFFTPLSAILISIVCYENGYFGRQIVFPASVLTCLRHFVTPEGPVLGVLCSIGTLFIANYDVDIAEMAAEASPYFWARVIYYNQLADGRIVLLIAYTKAKFDNLPVDFLLALQKEFEDA